MADRVVATQIPVRKKQEEYNGAEWRASANSRDKKAPGWNFVTCLKNPNCLCRRITRLTAYKRQYQRHRSSEIMSDLVIILHHHDSLKWNRPKWMIFQIADSTVTGSIDPLFRVYPVLGQNDGASGSGLRVEFPFGPICSFCNFGQLGIQAICRLI